jgi:two-component system secretion response regulator SsrB
MALTPGEISSGAATRVLVFDDRPLVADAFAHAITCALPNAEVRTTSEIAALAELVESWPADVALVHVRLWECAVGATVAVKARRRATAVVVVAPGASRDALAATLREGADAVVNPRGSFETLLQGLRSALAGERYLDEAMATELMGKFAREPANHPHRLTRREREVLLLSGEGESEGRIAAHLGMTKKTLHTHLRSLRRKLYPDRHDSAALGLA